MISVSDTMIMIVPDFGGSADGEAMVALKKAIEAAGSYTVKVVDLPAVVRAEHDGEELPDAKVIELSARKLEQLATCKELVWDGTNTLEQMKSRVIRLGWSDDKLRRLPEQDDEPEQHDEAEDNEEEEIFDFDEPVLSTSIDDVLRRRFPRGSDHDDYDWGAPDIVVVFGKSAMLAGGLERKNVLFINPEYDSEWPWKKQYYADQKLAGEYHCDKYEYERGFMETVLWAGVERTRPWQYSRRYGLITSADYIGEFWNRYPRMAEVDRGLDGDTDGLAKFICEFADHKLTFPLEEVYKAIKNLPGRDITNLNIICDFIEPVKLGDITVQGLRFGVPMSNGQSSNKLKVAEYDYTLPLERLHTRRELNALRDAIVLAGERMSAPPQKRILIVPDYFTPYDAPNIKELYERLCSRGYYVAEYVNGESLEKSRAGIERRCKVKPFDLIVTLETGCLVAGRVANCPRIMVNPDWDTWKWMKQHLGDKKQRMLCRGIDNSGPFYSFYLDREEVAMARQMAERSYFNRSDKPVYGWFTVDAVESHLPEEHLKRFNTSTYIPGLRLDTDEGIAVLARQIDNILTIDDNE